MAQRGNKKAVGSCNVCMNIFSLDVTVMCLWAFPKVASLLLKPWSQLLPSFYSGCDASLTRNTKPWPPRQQQRRHRVKDLKLHHFWSLLFKKQSDHAWCAFKKKKKKSIRGPQLPASQSWKGGEGEEETRVRVRERGHSEDEALASAAWGKILALGETWWCRDDIFRAAVRVIDEYQMLSITPWEKNWWNQKNTTTKDNVGIRGRI